MNLLKITDKAANKQLRQFAIASAVCGAVSLIIFWWLAIAGLAFGARATILSFHKTNASQTKYKILAFVGLGLSLITLVLYYSTE